MPYIKNVEHEKVVRRCQKGQLSRICWGIKGNISLWYELGEEPWLIRKISEMDRSAVLKGFWGCVKIKSSAMHDNILLLEKGW